MGCYDTIKFRCPLCQSIQLLQTKYGRCDLNVYTLETAPASILGSLENESVNCTVCEREIRFLVKAIATVYIPVADQEDE